MPEQNNASAKEFFGKTWFCADLTLCEAYLRALGLFPVCDRSVQALLINRCNDLRNEPEVASYIDVLNRVPVDSLEDLAQRVSDDARCVWISTGTPFGLPLREEPAVSVLRPLQLVGVAGVSPLTGGYGGLGLFEWVGTDLGRRIVKFYGGRQTTYCDKESLTLNTYALRPPWFSSKKIGAEIDGRLHDDAKVGGQPTLALIMGPVCSGKTKLRREHFGKGYVLIDAAQLFIDLGGIDLDFPSLLKEPMVTIGKEVARRAVMGHMNIVTEIVGATVEPITELIDAMTAAGYRVEVVNVTADLPICIEREKHRTRGNVSAYYAEHYQMNWLLSEAKRCRSFKSSTTTASTDDARLPEQFVTGDIVRYRRNFLALVTYTWCSTMATVSGRLVSLEFLGYEPHRDLGRNIGVIDAINVEYITHGVSPDVAIIELGIDDPWIMARMQAGIDASMCLQSGMPLQEAMLTARQRASDIFGIVPNGWVEMAVARVYAQNASIGIDYNNTRDSEDG